MPNLSVAACIALGAFILGYTVALGDVAEDCEDGGKSARTMLQAKKALGNTPTLVDSRWLDSKATENLLENSVQHVKPLPNESQVMAVRDIGCGMPLFAPSGRCPEDCPFFAAETRRKLACHFRCVKDTECGVLNPLDNVADRELQACRPCKVIGCEMCAPADPGKGEDKCAKCSLGYSAIEGGQCEGPFNLRTWSVVFGIIGVVVLLVASWYIHLRFIRPVVNNDGEAEGLAYRSHRKLRDEDGRLYPLTTSLHDVVVAGPGLLMHFDFQAALILWGCICISAWIVFAYSTEPALLLLGLNSADTPHELCAVTVRGRQAQREMMWAKVTFLVITYMFSFIGSLGYSIYHMRLYQKLDAATASMRDFAALCVVEGLSELEPDRLEERLQVALAASTGVRVIGVSVCWDFEAYADDVKALVEKLDDDQNVSVPSGRDGSASAAPAAMDQEQDETETAAKGCGFWVFDKVDSLFGFGPHAETSEHTAVEAAKLVHELRPTDACFVVFESEEARDTAVAAAQGAMSGGGLRFETCVLKLEVVDDEPDTVCWEMFNVPATSLRRRAVLGIFVVLLGVAMWCTFFYLPYAYYISSFSAAQGEEAGFLTSFLFSMLVVGGNQAMYCICNTVAYKVGYRFTDDAEAFYIILYTFACFMNLLVDLMLEVYLGYHAMVAAGVHTAEGTPLGDLTSYQEIFESYPVQRSIGKRLYEYCFPATFLIPFCVEPVGAYYLPYHIQRLLLRTHAGVRGRDAEKSMEFFTPMDLSRNGDLVLNVVLGCLVFFFPAGQLLKMLLALTVCHALIYCYDKYRVLRSVPSFVFAGCSADVASAAILAVPCGFMASCIVFKSNCEVGSPFCVRDERQLLFLCVSAFTVHVTIHLVLHFCVVPTFKGAKDRAEQSYEEVACATSMTWFTANPVHRLRTAQGYPGVTIPACDGRDVKRCTVEPEEFEY